MVAEIQALTGSPKTNEGQHVEETAQRPTGEQSKVSHQRGHAVDLPARPRSTEHQVPAHASISRAVGHLAQRAALDNIQPAPIPETPRVQIRERLHGHLVADPHRWLETPFEPSQRIIPHQEQKIRSWMQAQNARTTHAIAQDKPLQSYLQRRFYELQDRPMMRRAQSVENLGTIQWRRDSAADSWKMHVRFEADEASAAKETDDSKQIGLFADELPQTERINGKVLLDEKAICAKLGLAASSFVDDFSFSPDAKYLALAIGEYHGDDRRKIAFIEVRTGEPVEGSGVLTHVKWSQLEWLDETRLIYGKVQMSNDELLKNAPDVVHQQMLHTVGTNQSEDLGLFEGDAEPWVHSNVWQQGDRLYRMRSWVGTDRSVLESAELDVDALLSDDMKFFPVYDAVGVEAPMGFLPGTSRYLVRTKKQEDGTISTGRLAYVDTNDPERKFETLIASISGREMEGAIVAGDKIVVDFQVNLGRRLAVYDNKGNLEREIDFQEAGLPSGSIGSMRYDYQAEKLIVNYASPLSPPADYAFDLETGAMQALEPSNFPFDGSLFAIDEISFPSKDGTEIPMRIVRAKEGYEKDGNNPTIVYGYGGFEADIADNQFVMARLIPFLEAGGTVALPALRGGAELGDAWHEEGKKEKKQNVFDDYYGAAQALIDLGYTCPERLAGMGASNGGLLTGAAIVQQGKRLFKAIAPHAGVLDMLRFPEFSSGRWWIDEYGNPINAEEFETLYGYSPYHNLEDGDFPAVLITTGMFDSRVDPSHSRKFLAGLQYHQKGDAPIFGYFNPDAGHFANKHPQRQSEFLALRMGFIMQQLGMKPPVEDSTKAP